MEKRKMGKKKRLQGQKDRRPRQDQREEPETSRDSVGAREPGVPARLRENWGVPTVLETSPFSLQLVTNDPCVISLSSVNRGLDRM